MEYCFVENGYKLLLEKSSAGEKFEELFSKIQKKFEREVDPSSKKTIIDIFGILEKNDRITFITPYLRLAVMEKWMREGDVTDQQKSVYESEKSKLEKRDSDAPYIKNTLQNYKRDVTHYFGSEIYKGYLRDYNFSGKSLAYPQHLSEMDSIIKRMENRGKQFIDISSKDVDGQDMILNGKDSNGLYYEWWSLNSVSCNKKESDLMGHCGENERANNMLSMRIPIEKHLKKEYNLSEKEYKNMRKPVLTFAVDDTTLVESHGRYNNKPESKYHEAIVALLNSEYIDLISQHGAYRLDDTFKLEDLSSELREQVDIEEEDVERADYFDWEEMENDIHMGSDVGIEYTISSDYQGDGVVFKSSDTEWFNVDVSSTTEKLRSHMKDLGFKEDMLEEILNEFDPRETEFEFNFNVDDYETEVVSDVLEDEIEVKVEYVHEVQSIDVSFTEEGGVILPEDGWNEMMDSLKELESAVKSISEENIDYREEELIDQFITWFGDRVEGMIADEEVDDYHTSFQAGMEKGLGYLIPSDKEGYYNYQLILRRDAPNGDPFYDSELYKKLIEKKVGGVVELNRELNPKNQKTFDFYDKVKSKPSLTGILRSKVRVNGGTRVLIRIDVEVEKEGLDLVKFFEYMESVKKDFREYEEGDVVFLENYPKFKKMLSLIQESI